MGAWWSSAEPGRMVSGSSAPSLARLCKVLFCIAADDAHSFTWCWNTELCFVVACGVCCGWAQSPPCMVHGHGGSATAWQGEAAPIITAQMSCPWASSSAQLTPLHGALWCRAKLAPTVGCLLQLAGGLSSVTGTMSVHAQQHAHQGGSETGLWCCGWPLCCTLPAGCVCP